MMVFDAILQEQVDTLRTWIDECPPGCMVFFGGAGVSTESGIKDFRSAEGLYNQKTKWPYPPETMISRSFFDSHPHEFFDYYCSCMLPGDARPNQAHLKLAELEAKGKLSGVITQNIDGLHQKAKSKEVYELHGSVLRNYCMKCHRFYDLPDMLALRDASTEGIPYCECGGIIKPDVVLYEEALDASVMERAISAISRAELLLVAGTSLAVYPAAGLIEYFSNDRLAIVNRDPTPYDTRASLCIAASIGAVMDF